MSDLFESRPAHVVVSAVEVERRKSAAFRDVLETWSTSDLMDCLDKGDLVEMIIENDVFPDSERDEILKRPEYAEERKRNSLSDDLEPVRLCGGAKTPAEERALYEQAMHQGAA